MDTDMPTDMGYTWGECGHQEGHRHEGMWTWAHVTCKSMDKHGTGGMGLWTCMGTYTDRDTGGNIQAQEHVGARGEMTLDTCARVGPQELSLQTGDTDLSTRVHTHMWMYAPVPHT